MRYFEVTYNNFICTHSKLFLVAKSRSHVDELVKLFDKNAYNLRTTELTPDEFASGLDEQTRDSA